MEHFDDVEDQVRICFDEIKIQVPVEEFGAFKSNGLTGIGDGYEIIKGCIAQGKGKDLNNVPSLSPVQIESHISERILKHTQ